MHSYHDETCSGEIRWHKPPGEDLACVLQQKWFCTLGNHNWEEWRDVPTFYSSLPSAQ